MIYGIDRIGHSKGLALIQGGPRHREMRKHFHAEIGGRNIDQFASYIESQAPAFLQKLLQEPEEFREHIRWWAIA
jgi:cytochrome P450